jgi:alkylation response protein AidB-like acyl-CoA dehydrogenase
MNPLYPASDRAFAEEVDTFLRAHLPAPISQKVLDHRRLEKADYVAWQDILARRGWLTGNWPREYGGLGWTPMQTHIFDELCAIHGATRLVPFGLRMVAPVIMAFGTPWQKEVFLPEIRENRVWWCQGYSEPNAGSDLASLQTRARRDGNHYVVNGQKTWATQAQYADKMFCLVRTSSTEKRQDGISFLLIDMKSPGVTVRPILTFDEEHTVNDVFLEDVRVPVEWRVGEEGRGWTCAKYLLGHERTVLARVGDSKRELATLKRCMRKADPERRAPWRAAVLQRVARVELELAALEVTLLRSLVAAEGSLGPETSVQKIVGTQIQQELSELLLEVSGPDALPFDPLWRALEQRDGAPGPSWATPLAANYLDLRKLSIIGGTNEIQRNIIAQRVLEL